MSRYVTMISDTCLCRSVVAVGNMMVWFIIESGVISRL